MKLRQDPNVTISSASARPFETAIDAWIDVGGTFTDCFTRLADGVLLSCKILSSGRVPIRLSATRRLDATADYWFHSPELASDCDEFWTGAELVVLNGDGQELQRSRVLAFQASELQLENPLLLGLEANPSSEQSHVFELDSGVEAPVLGVHRLLSVPLSLILPRLRVRLGTTRGTNALLTRTGARTALAITAPFEDLLKIGDQTRPDLFDLSVRKRAPLAEWILGITERIDVGGTVRLPLDAEQSRTQLRAAREAGIESLAICLVHSYVNAEHEQKLKEVALQAGFRDISVSSDLAPLIEIVARAQTTVVDAYLNPIIRKYLQRLREQFSHGNQADAGLSLEVMTSAGGLVDWQTYAGKDSILSGPAGGVCALRALRVSVGVDPLIGFDMGGTSTDVCRVSGEHDLQYESTKAGVRILTPTLPIETVASGGGSICWFDGVSLRVGPQSAGARPGPACYGRGGPLTITDLNVFLGRIPKNQFPFPVDDRAIELRLDALIDETSQALGKRTREELAQGFRRIANEQMAEAVRSVTIAKGVDPRSHALVGFGGAAGQHVCEIAESLGIQRVIDPPHAGLLSALGMGMADARLDAALPVYCELSSIDWTSMAEQIQTRLSELSQQLVDHGARENRLLDAVWLELRYLGTDSTLSIAWDNSKHADHVVIEQQFHNSHSRRFGYCRQEHSIELVSIRVECISPGSHALVATSRATELNFLPRKGDRPEYSRSQCQPGNCIQGPAIVCSEGSTLVIDPGWTAEVLSDGTMQLSHTPAAHLPVARAAQGAVDSGPNLSDSPPNQERIQRTAFSTSTVGSQISSGKFSAEMTDCDPIFRDCYAARLTAIATQMGLVLQQTAVSVNVKQRRDFSCAVFDASGHLLASAPHVPVHLGAMGHTVRAILERFPNIRPGDSFITNDPYCGGSHLPDITVVTPVFAQSTSENAVMFVANRAHHADVGGISPGSMSVNATELGQEGVVIPPMRLSQSAVDHSQDLVALFQQHPYPPRNIRENLADIAGQRAANARGIDLLEQYAAMESWDKLTQYADHLLSAAEQRIRQFIMNHPFPTRSFVDHLDDGTPICVRISHGEPGELNIDFTGSGPESKSNFNANPSIVKAAIMYVLRCLLADDLPLNEGILRCIQLTIPRGILNPTPNSQPSRSPAVAAGNVETSQRIVDVLLGAFEVAAASQGTMNNLLFGNKKFGFYETICGGAGATPSSQGESAVHTHMTNTRLTDLEVLEANYPVQLVYFGIRHGSGGSGALPGGDGVIREIEFLEPVTVSLISSRRGHYEPFGLAGGKPGSRGINLLTTRDRTRQLDACSQFDAAIGDRLRIETPGGGGYGPAPKP